MSMKLARVSEMPAAEQEYYLKIGKLRSIDVAQGDMLPYEGPVEGKLSRHDDPMWLYTVDNVANRKIPGKGGEEIIVTELMEKHGWSLE